MVAPAPFVSVVVPKTKSDNNEYWEPKSCGVILTMVAPAPFVSVAVPKTKSDKSPFLGTKIRLKGPPPMEDSSTISA